MGFDFKMNFIGSPCIFSNFPPPTKLQSKNYFQCRGFVDTVWNIWMRKNTFVYICWKMKEMCALFHGMPQKLLELKMLSVVHYFRCYCIWNVLLPELEFYCKKNGVFFLIRFKNIFSSKIGVQEDKNRKQDKTLRTKIESKIKPFGHIFREKFKQIRGLTKSLE